MENQCRHDNAEENADDTIADIVEICIWRVTLETLTKKGEGYLQAGVSNSFGSGSNPASNQSDTRNQDYKRGDRFHVGDKEHDREKRECSADQTPRDSENALAHRGSGAFQRNENASDE